MKKHKFITLILVIGIVPNFVNAKPEFKPAADCGSAKVVSGDTCSNVKVELDLKGCLVDSSSVMASKIVCEGSKIKARYQVGNYRYEGQFNKEQDGWGGVAWKQLGNVRQWEKLSESTAAPAPVAKVSPPPPTTPSIVAPAAETAAQPTQTSSLKFSGFADLRYTEFSSENNKSGNGHAESGFGFEDGAIYVNYDRDKVSLVADIAIRRGKDVDTDAAATTPQQSSNNNLGIGVERSQVYLRYRVLDGLTFDLGQWDTVYGVELNDSKDRIFGKTGIVYDQLLPVTHTGVKVEYTVNGMYAKALAANPNNKGTFGTSATQDENTEYGAAVGYSNTWIRGQAGYLTRTIANTSGARDSRSLIDLIVGTTLGKFSVDLEYGMLTDPSKDLLTPGTPDEEDAGNGFLALASYRINDAFLVGARYELVENLTHKKIDSYGGSLHYRLSTDLVVRTEYVAYQNQSVAGPKWNDQRFNVAGVVTF